jgi:radical SAM enzyme (TIGR01210 family)
MSAVYPGTASERDRFVLAHRPPRREHDPWRYQGLIVEDERTATGNVARVATVLLTGRECPWRCAMCDLWMHTTADETPRGAIPAQVSAARETLPKDGEVVCAMKLYNAGSFFDPRAVPEDDYEDIAAALTGLSHVIVESHPALVGPRVDGFLAALRRTAGPALEVAMGLETAHPEALDRLNKRITVAQFAEASAALRARDVSLRVFLLISVPFISAGEQDLWLERSIDAAFDCGASVISLVPTRSGNGTLDVLPSDEFVMPRLGDIERSLELALNAARGRGRVFVDLWDLERFASCGECLAARTGRLHAMNLRQQNLPAHSCGECGGS